MIVIIGNLICADFVAAAVSGMISVSSLEQISISSGTWYAVIDLTNALFFLNAC